MFVKISLIAAFGFLVMGAMTAASASEGAGPSAMALSSMRAPSPDAWNASTSPEGRGNTTVSGARDRAAIVVAENESSNENADSDSDSDSNDSSDDQANSDDPDRQDRQDQMDQQSAGNQTIAPQVFSAQPDTDGSDAGEIQVNPFTNQMNPNQQQPQVNPYQ